MQTAIKNTCQKLQRNRCGKSGKIVTFRSVKTCKSIVRDIKFEGFAGCVRERKNIKTTSTIMPKSIRIRPKSIQIHPKSTKMVPRSAPKGIPEASRLQVTKKGATSFQKFRILGGKGRPKGPFSDPGKIANGSKIVLWSINRRPGPPKRPSGRGSGKNLKFDEKSMRKSPVFDGPEHTPALDSSIIIQYHHFRKSPEISPGRAPESHPNRSKTRLGADPGRSLAPFVTFLVV